MISNREESQEIHINADSCERQISIENRGVRHILLDLFLNHEMILLKKKKDSRHLQ